MIKRGDIVFGFSISVLILLILLLLIPVPQQVIVSIAVGAVVSIFVFVFVSMLTIPKPEQENPQIRAIEKLISEAESTMEHDIQKSIAIYKEIKEKYSGLESKEKSKVLRNIMRLYLKLLENLHLKH